jgi:dihydropteroate synthase
MPLTPTSHIPLPGGRRLELGARTLIMGILNVTDDSFSGDGLGERLDAALAQAEGFLRDGADILDVGAESTRPGSEPVSEAQELARLVPFIAALRERTDCAVSVDTTKPVVAREALVAGADIINDINGLRAEGMVELAAQTGAPVVIMHMLGTPRDMQRNPQYGDVVAEVAAFLMERAGAARAAGVQADRIILDPGFGFGKTVAHNLELLRRLEEFAALGYPLLLGTSRKSTLGKVLGDAPPDQRLMGTAATCAIGICKGAHILRVHDVREIAQVARMTDAVLHGWEEA